MNEFHKFYEEYKEQVRLNQDWVDECKLRVEKIIKEKNLYPIMNDTKWLKLQYNIKDLKFPPVYFEKYVTDEEAPSYTKNLENYIPIIYGDLGNGEWGNFYEEELTVLFNIEWLKVIPKYEKYLGKLIPGEIYDEEKEFRLLLDKLFIPYEYSEGVFTIFGYKTLSNKAELLEQINKQLKE